MSRIYWDTMLFVYWLEDHPQHAGRVEDIFTAIQRRRDTLCSSVITLGEILTGVYKKNAPDLAARIRSFFQPTHVELLSFTIETADRYAQIRGEHRVTPSDAMHLATAAQIGVNLFLTNDRRLQKLVIPGIDFIAGMDVNLF